MKGWLFLVIAIVGEVIATSALKSSEGFTKLAPSAVVIIGYGGNDSNLLIVFYVQ
ncbi:TPA: DMT family transporter, partial [Escherichia coli]